MHSGHELGCIPPLRAAFKPTQWSSESGRRCACVSMCMCMHVCQNLVFVHLQPQLSGQPSSRLFSVHPMGPKTALAHCTASLDLRSLVRSSPSQLRGPPAAYRWPGCWMAISQLVSHLSCLPCPPFRYGPFMSLQANVIAHAVGWLRGFLFVLLLAIRMHGFLYIFTGFSTSLFFSTSSFLPPKHCNICSA